MRDAERNDRIREALAEAGLDGVVCALPANVLMLTGYWPVVGTSIAVVGRDGRNAIVAPEDERDLAEPCAETHTFSSVSQAEGVLRRLLRDFGLEHGVVGCESGEIYEPASYASMHLYGRRLMEWLGSPVPADDMLARLRSVATPMELDRIRRACRIAALAFTQGTAAMAAGKSEIEAAAAFFCVLAVKGIGFEGVQRAGGMVACMSGPDAARAYGAYARSRARVIELGDLALTHCNSYADGYWTDITRTFAIGETRRDLYEAVFEARAAALDAIRIGARGSDVDHAARDSFRRRGLEKHFKHPAGHGVGFAAIDHQATPRLAADSQHRLEPGMVFNVEPALYIEGETGLRHCDMVAMTENGMELLTPFLCEIGELMR